MSLVNHQLPMQASVVGLIFIPVQKFEYFETVLLSVLKLYFIQVSLPELRSVFSYSYPCEWGGVVDGKPYLKNLEVFGRAVLEDVWTAVVQQFVEVILSVVLEKSCSIMKLIFSILC